MSSTYTETTAPRAAPAVRIPSPRSLKSARVRRYYPCPICGGIDQCLVEQQDDNRLFVWCIRGQYHEGGSYVPGWGHRGRIWFFDLDATTYTPRPRRSERRYRPVASEATIHEILTCVAEILPLSDAHRTLLARRGYRLEDCGSGSRHIFATLPADVNGRAQVAEAIRHRYPQFTPEDILGTYGFDRDERRRDAEITFLKEVRGSALLEFIRDVSGRLIGFQYATDIPVFDDKGKRIKKRAYPLRMSFRGRFHVAQPTVDDGLEVWVTEAIHKANLTADAMRAPAIGSLTKSNQAGMFAGVRAVDPDRRRVVVLALDTDVWESEDEARVTSRLLDAGYQVKLARWTVTTAKGPDDALLAGDRIEYKQFHDTRKHHRREQRHEYTYPWQKPNRSHAAHEDYLNAIVRQAAVEARGHIASTSDQATPTALAINLPPGAGKTQTIGPLGDKSVPHPGGCVDVAWIAERRDMIREVDPQGRAYRHIDPCSEYNCPDAQVINALANRGYRTTHLHYSHPGGRCAYISQFEGEGSAIYQLPHVSMPYILNHEALVIDEFSLSNWLRGRRFTLSQLRQCAGQFSSHRAAYALLQALQAILDEARTCGDLELHGKALLDSLDRHCDHRLLALLKELEGDPCASQKPAVPQEIDFSRDSAEVEQQIARLPPVILPFICQALGEERDAWARGNEWNSLLYVCKSSANDGEYALHITEPLRFHDRHRLPPLILLDATPAPLAVLQSVLGTDIKIHAPLVIPPSSMRHIAVRTGARYSKQDLTHPSGTFLKRIAKRARCILHELDPDGSLLRAGEVGLVTFMGCEEVLASELGIAYGDRTCHFWGCRGTNRLQDCRILLVIGTPMIPPDEIIRWARAIYRSDPKPIDTTPLRDDRGRWIGYADVRLQELIEYQINSELTQAAHRNRPLRFEDRTVVTFCIGDIGHLPITTEITEFPFLTDDGRNADEIRAGARDARLADAARQLCQEGRKVTARALYAIAHMRMNDINAWLHERRAQEDDSAKLLSTTLDRYPPDDPDNMRAIASDAPSSVLQRESNAKVLSRPLDRCFPDALDNSFAMRPNMPLLAADSLQEIDIGKVLSMPLEGYLSNDPDNTFAMRQNASVLPHTGPVSRSLTHIAPRHAAPLAPANTATLEAPRGIHETHMQRMWAIPPADAFVPDYPPSEPCVICGKRLWAHRRDRLPGWVCRICERDYAL